MEGSLSELERLNSEKDQSIKELHLEMTSLRTEVDLLVSRFLIPLCQTILEI